VSTTSAARRRVASLACVSLAAGLVLAGCAAQASAGKSAAPPAVERFYPLRAGSVWTYDVDTGEGVPVLAITRVVAREGNSARVSSGAEPVAYEQRTDGLFRPGRNAYLLKAPLVEGASWDDGEGGVARITRTGVTLSTVAGSFSGCVEVSEGGSAKQVRTVFCPDVGPVELESSMAMALTGKSVRVKASLRGYDFSGALGEPPATP
jgi:hypothetical protein